MEQPEDNITTNDAITTAPYAKEHRYTQPDTNVEAPHFIPQAWSRVTRSISEIEAHLTQDMPPSSLSSHIMDEDEAEEEEDMIISDGAFGDMAIKRKLAQEKRYALQKAREEEEAERKREW